MARIPEIVSKLDLPEDKQRIFDDITADFGRASVPFAILLNSPDLAGRLSSVRKYLFSETTLTPMVKTLAILVAARESDCPFEWSTAAVWWRELGAREEAIDVVGHRRPLDSLTQEEALIVAYGREMIRDHHVSDVTFEAAKARFGSQALIDLTATLGFYTMIGHMLNAVDLKAPPDLPQLP